MLHFIFSKIKKNYTNSLRIISTHKKHDQDYQTYK